MNPTFKNQLKYWERQHQVHTPNKKPTKKPQKAKSVHLSESDIKSLMGMDMRTYSRHRGAVRQK